MQSKENVSKQNKSQPWSRLPGFFKKHIVVIFGLKLQPAGLHKNSSRKIWWPSRPLNLSAGDLSNSKSGLMNLFAEVQLRKVLVLYKNSTGGKALFKGR